MSFEDVVRPLASPLETEDESREQKDQEIRLKVRQFLSDSFAEFKNTGTFSEGEVFSSNQFAVTDDILHFLDADEPDGRITPRQQERVGLFFDELTTFIRETRLDADSRSILPQYLSTWREQVFSVSPSIFNRLSLEDQLITSLTLSKIPEAQGNLGQNVGELVYGLQYNFDDDGREQLFQSILHRLPLERQLDAVDYLATIAADALAQGWADDAFYSITRLLSEIQADQTVSPFLAYAATTSATQLEHESEDPTRGVVIRGGDRTVGRVVGPSSEEIAQESTVISQHLIPDVDSVVESTFRSIARDAVATFDHSMTAQGVASIDTRAFAPRPGIPSAYDLYQIKRAVEQERIQRLDRVLDFVIQRVVKVIDPNHPEKELQRMSSVLSAKEWIDYVRLEDQISEIQARLQKRSAELTKKVEEKNEQATQGLCTKVLAQLPKLRQEYVGDKMVLKMLQEYEAARSLEEQFRTLVQFSGLRELLARKPVGHLEDIFSQLQEVEQFHQSSWDGARQDMAVIEAELQEEAAPLFLKRKKLTWRIMKSPDLVGDIQKYVDEVVVRSEYQRVHFASFDQIVEGGTMQARGAAESVDVATLLQELHRPAMRQAIENDMGISLADLSVREQVQLLSFLTSSDRATVAAAFAVIRQYGLNAARTFLSCEYGAQYGEAIVTLAGSLDLKDADAIFKRYAEISDAVGHATEDLLSSFYIVHEGKRVDRNKIDEELLARAKEILRTFAERIRVPGAKIDHVEVEAALDRFTKDTVLFASMFKEAAKGKKMIEFGEIRGLGFEEKKASELTDQEREQMRGIMDENWLTQLPSVRAFLLSGFEKKIAPSNQTTRFYILKRDGKSVAFVRFDERPDLGPQAVYGGSFNVAAELRGSALGESLLRAAVEKEARGNQIYADFFPEVLAGTMYIEQFGHVVVGIEDVQVSPDKKERRLLMVRDDATNPRYRARQPDMTQERLKKMVGQKSGEQSVCVVQFELPKEKTEFLDRVTAEANDNRVMTRYFADAKNSAIRYVVFEPRLSSEEDVSLAA